MTENLGPTISLHPLDALGIRDPNRVYWNLPVPSLFEEVIRRGEGKLSVDGSLVVATGNHTGRSPLDKFIADEASSTEQIWWGQVNRAIDESQFNDVLERMLKHIDGLDLFVFDGYAGADPTHRLPVRIITEYAWHSLFARNMFLPEFDPGQLASLEPGFTVLDIPSFHANPETDGTHSPTMILMHFGRRLVLIGRTEYAGEIKKSIFTAMNYMLPNAGVLPMHCSANYGESEDDVALFFGLSGTGKTTLSNVPDRTLIGDDEHGWGDRGVFNFEGGSYAKVIRLDPEAEPLIDTASRQFGAILENVVMDEASRIVDFDDGSLTENTRASYPLHHIANASDTGHAGHPRNVLFLTADAFGVLPPISRLSREQAMYHFLSGYTAKVAGTERGVTEPKPVFSVCFGAPFMPLRPMAYASLLGEMIEKHNVNVWLINTGWTGGPYGVGKRMNLGLTRRMVDAILTGELESVATETEPHFGLEIPAEIDGVPAEILQPRQTWADAGAYDRQAEELVKMFADNFKTFAELVDPAVLAAGPSG